MAAPWATLNPDNRVDQLPQPFRTINKILEDVLQAVGEQIGEIDRRRKSAEYEHGLLQAMPSKVVAVAGSVTCSHAEARGMPRIAIGTSHGEVCIVDTTKQEVIAQKHALGDGEAVHCIALSSEGVYAPRPPPPGQEVAPHLGRPNMKLFVAGRATPRIWVFNVCKGTFGSDLKPACTIHVPEPPPAQAEGDAEAQPRPPAVQQLHVRGTNDGIWVVALMFDRTLRAYLCPLGPPEDAGGATSEGTVLDQAILEDEEEGEGEEGKGDAEDFARTPQVKTPVYCFSLQSMAPMPGLPEPGLDSLVLTAFSVRVEGGPIALGTAAKQVPLICMVSSPESSIVLGYSFTAPDPLAAPAGLDAEALLKQRMPAVGELKDPEESRSLKPRRRWALPARTTAVAASPDGCLFAAGGSAGSLALIDTALGPSLKAMLPGHYAELTAMTFHRSLVLVSAGADGWIHHYNLQTNTLMVRYLCSPPPTPAPVTGLVSAQTLPLAMSLDGAGGLRLLDLRRHRKMANALWCQGPGGADAPGEGAESEVAGVGRGGGGGAAGAEGVAGGPSAGEAVEVDELPRQVISSSTGFCVVCEFKPESANDSKADDGTANSAEAGGEVAEEEDDESQRSCLVFFDFGKTLKALYPGLPAKIERGGAALVAAFATLPLEGTSKDQLPSATTPALEASTSSVGAGTRAAQTLPSKGLKDGSQQKEVVQLTAANLKRMGGTGGHGTANSVAASGIIDLSDLGGGVMGEVRERKGKASGLPENWQVSVRRSLRAGLSQKENRLRHIHQRMEQLKKDLGDT
mmetsp:Transcript_178529/g.572150  ORF Transcript_178529/g.572150 Transcript_178529/m.572150 type:complete len:798 (+) Transcript_178529:154-2547(+)